MGFERFAEAMYFLFSSNLKIFQEDLTSSFGKSAEIRILPALPLPVLLLVRCCTGVLDDDEGPAVWAIAEEGPG